MLPGYVYSYFFNELPLRSQSCSMRSKDAHKRLTRMTLITTLPTATVLLHQEDNSARLQY